MEPQTAPIFNSPADLCAFFHDDAEGFGDMCMRVMESLGYVDGRTRIDGKKFYATFQHDIVRCVFQCGNMPYKEQISARDIYDAKEFFKGASYSTYITGSVFQPAALDYARKCDVHPVDGRLLILLLRKANLLDMQGHYRMKIEKKDTGVSVNNMQRMDPSKFIRTNRKP